MADSTIVQSRYGYEETLARITQAIHGSGATLFASIDQSAAAATVGLTLRPTTLLIFGNPKGGTPVMDAYPEAALDLPLRLLVWQEHDTVKVGHIDFDAFARRYGIAENDPLLAPLRHAVEALVALIIG